MKNMKTGAYFMGDESIGFNFGTDLSTVEKLKFVNSVVGLVVDGEHYNSILRDLAFDFFVVDIFTDIDTNEIKRSDYFIADAEKFLEDTNIVDIVKANMDDGLLNELNKAINLSIEYKTGIHPNPFGETLASLVSTLEKKVNTIDLESAMGMATKFLGMTEDLTPESVVNAYINSDMHKKNLENIDESKKQREMLAQGLANVIDIAVEEAKEEIKQEN